MMQASPIPGHTSAAAPVSEPVQAADDSKVVPIYVLCGQSNADRGGVDSALLHDLAAGGGTFELVKFAAGATALHQTNAPQGDWNIHSDGELYDGLVAAIKARIDYVIAQGDTPEIRGVFWIQGEYDGFTEADAQAYAANLTEFINQLRADLATDMPFLLSSLLDNSLDDFESDVRASQQQVAASVDKTTLVDSTGLTFLPDDVHYSGDSRIEMAHRLSAALPGGAPTTVVDGYHSDSAPQVISGTAAGEQLRFGDDFCDLIIDAGAGNDVVVTGGGNNTVTGGIGNDVLRTLLGNDTVYGGDGSDTIITSFNYDTLLAPYGPLHSWRGFDNDSVDAGAGNDTITDYVGDNMIRGGTGNDTVVVGYGYDWIDGGDGDDMITGGMGNDTIGGGDGIDTAAYSGNRSAYSISVHADGTVTLSGAEGTDQLSSIRFIRFADQTFSVPAAAVSAGTADNDYVNGAAANDSLAGLAGDDTIFGLAGNDSVDGGLGADSLVGGLGNDTYVVDNHLDIVTELNNQGVDTLLSSVSWSLSNASSIEVLTLTGPQHINAIGNANANVLNGNSGNNTLNGGSGADTLTGGAGHDLYLVDNAGDVVIEGVNAGTDTVQSSVSFVLDGNFENLTLAGIGNINGTGNSLVNTIYGNSGNNVLTGGGGGDKIYGRAGNDTYIIDNAGVGVSEVLAGADAGGTDLVVASISYTLGLFVENLTLVGSVNLNGVGNGLNNSLTGNAGKNILTGGAGNDTMIGGTGADQFAFAAGSGVDWISDFSAAQGDRINVHAITNGTVNGGGITFAQVGADTVIDLGGGNTVTVGGTVVSDVTSHMVW